jgi:hypothetical protein
MTACRSTDQSHPQCGGHHKLAKMCVVRDLMKVTYTEDHFTCFRKSQDRVPFGGAVACSQ